MGGNLGRRTIVTIVGLGALGCSGVGLIPKAPPPEPLTFATPPPLGKQVPRDQRDKFTETVNPRSAGRTVYRGGGQCWVHGEFDEPPTSVQPPPRDYLVCPEEMLDDKWEACPGGTVRVTDAGKPCLCAMDGNPPPPDRFMKCPKV